MLSAIALTACEDDTTIINPDPGHPSTLPDETAGATVLSSRYSPNSDLVFFNIGESGNSGQEQTINGRKDYVKVLLSSPFDKDVVLRIGMAQEYMSDAGYASGIILKFNKEHGYKVTFPSYTDLTVNGDTYTTVKIKAGSLESEEVELCFLRDNLSLESYLFPIQVTDQTTGELLCETNYIVTPQKEKAEIIGKKPSVFIGYIDTEVMNPLITDKFTYELSKDDFLTGEHIIIYSGPFFDILNVRTSLLKNKDGNISIELTPDLEYVLKNRAKYIAPMQKEGLNVCLCIKGGNSGVGFSNMTDGQITQFCNIAKVLIDMYGLDGINLWDEGAGYDKEGAAPVKAESYAKLIKSIKTAMPDKLLTLVDTRATTEALCDDVEGIRVGDYIDYAWSSLEDYIAPYEPDATIRPLANVEESKYGTFFMRDPAMFSEEESMMLFENPVFGPYLNMMKFTPMSGTDVFVVYDIPYMDYGKENVWAFASLFDQCKYPMPEDFSYMTSYSYSYPLYMSSTYYAFKKDW